MNYKHLITGSILLIAIFLRIWNLNLNPPSLNWDEISLGYNAFSILKTGHDEWGFTLPLNFRAYGDYKLPVYVYTDVPFIALFGLNEWGVRLPSALAGIGVVVLTFLILKQLTGKIEIAWGGMFLAATVPWLFFSSRIALEANLALFLTILAYYLFLLSIKKPNLLILSAFIFGLTFFTYNSSRVIGVPLLICMIIFYFKHLKRFRIQSLVSLIILGAFFAITVPTALLQDSSARYRWTTILDEGAIQRINQARGTSSLPAPWPKIINNKVSYFTLESAHNYILHFDPVFLFFKGGSNYQYSMPGRGLIYPIEFILLLLGLFVIAQQRKNWQLFILSWLLIAPLPGAITRDAPHALRSIFLAIPLILISALGIELLIKRTQYKIFWAVSTLIVLIIGLNTLDLWSIYNSTYRQNYSWSWQYGYKQAVQYLVEHPEYSQVILTKKYGEPHEFVLFYTRFNPADYQHSQNLIRYQRSDWFWVDQFDKYQFINDWEVKQKTADIHQALLITSPGNYPSHGQKLTTIYFLDNTAAFDVVKL